MILLVCTCVCNMYKHWFGPIIPSFLLLQVLQASDLPAGLVNVISGGKDQLTVALANHSVIKAVWYWGSAEVRTLYKPHPRFNIIKDA